MTIIRKLRTKKSFLTLSTVRKFSVTKNIIRTLQEIRKNLIKRSQKKKTLTFVNLRSFAFQISSKNIKIFFLILF